MGDSSAGNKNRVKSKVRCCTVPREELGLFTFGCILTFLYLIGAIVIIALYWKFELAQGSPVTVDYQYVPVEKIKNGSMHDYVCNCDFPPEILSYVGVKDTRKSNDFLTRCFKREELKTVDLLQYSNYDHVPDIIQKKEKGSVRTRTFNEGYHLKWESYELISRKSGIDPFNGSDHRNPLRDISNTLTDKGYIGQNGIMGFRSLAENDFFSPPPSFVRAEVSYNCITCDMCQELWVEYSFEKATQLRGSVRDSGWIFCYDTAPSGSSSCRGDCRFFRTQSTPWGIEMSAFAKKLWRYVQSPKKLSVIFHTRLLYANVSQILPIEDYQLRFLEVDRSTAVWDDLVDEYRYISNCSERKDEVSVCNGTSICEVASSFNPRNPNMDILRVACENHEVDKYREKCTDIVNTLRLQFRGKKEATLERVCEKPRCIRVPSSHVQWNYVNLTKGETALSNLIYETSIVTTYRPGVCINNYPNLILNRGGDGDGGSLLSIHQTECADDISSGCWLTGKYKNMTDTYDEPWRSLTHLSPTEVNHEGGQPMFACYRFDQEPYYLWLYISFGTVSGALVSLLLGLRRLYRLVFKFKQLIRPWLEETCNRGRSKAAANHVAGDSSTSAEQSAVDNLTQNNSSASIASADGLGPVSRTPGSSPFVELAVLDREHDPKTPAFSMWRRGFLNSFRQRVCSRWKRRVRRLDRSVRTRPGTPRERTPLVRGCQRHPPAKENAVNAQLMVVRVEPESEVIQVVI